MRGEDHDRGTVGSVFLASAPRRRPKQREAANAGYPGESAATSATYAGSTCRSRLPRRRATFWVARREPQMESPATFVAGTIRGALGAMKEAYR